eukprot:PhF_6_TR32239/c0_g1_i1/m.47905
MMNQCDSKSLSTLSWVHHPTQIIFLHNQYLSAVVANSAIVIVVFALVYLLSNCCVLSVRETLVSIAWFVHNFLYLGTCLALTTVLNFKNKFSDDGDLGVSDSVEGFGVVLFTFSGPVIV